MAKMTTGKQMANKLKKSGFDMTAVATIEHREISIAVKDKYGVDYDKTKRAVNKAAKILGKGYVSTGWGGYRISAEASESMGDFMDKGSKWHY